MNGRREDNKLLAWMKISRLQFFPMTWLAYSLGSLANSVASGKFSLPFYLLGYLIIFLIELCTILVNEYNDYETDRANNNYSPFTGGSRVLVEGKLNFREVKTVIFFILASIPFLGYLLAQMSAGSSSLPVYFFIAVGLFLGLGYTLPPLKFSYRGAGEIVVGVTHSFYVILCGFVFQGGSWQNPLPWLLGIPLFFSILGAIVLAGLPDRQADRAVKKRTLAVVFGPQRAIVIAMTSVVTAFLAGIPLLYFRVIQLPSLFWGFLVLPHGLILLHVLFRLLKSNFIDGRINTPLVLSLTYIIWFGILPFISLW